MVNVKSAVYPTSDTICNFKYILFFCETTSFRKKITQILWKLNCFVKYSSTIKEKNVLNINIHEMSREIEILKRNEILIFFAQEDRAQRME